MTGNAAGIVSGRVIGTIITPDRLERAKKLQAAGFVHVTGLPCINRPEMSCYLHACGATEALARRGLVDDDAKPVRPKAEIIVPHLRWLGRSDYNNGKAVIYTEDGEVWLGTGKALNSGLHHVCCPKGSGAYVPCSNGEEIAMHLLMERVADPYSDCHGHHSPIQEIMG